MNFWMLIFASLSYAAIMLTTYTLFYGFTKHWFVKFKIYYEIAIGIFFGIISVLAILASSAILLESENKKIIMLLPIITFWIGFIFISPFSSFGILTANILLLTVLPLVFPTMFIMPVEKYEIITITLSYSLAIILYGLKFIIKNLTPPVIWTILTLLSLTIGIITALSYLDDKLFLIELQYLVIWAATGYMMVGLIIIINQIYNHAIKLQNIVSFDNEHYINITSANSEIYNFIQKNKIKHGLYINYFISEYDKFEKLVNPEIKEFIINHITKQIYNEFSAIFKEDIIFFKANYKMFGLFIKVDNLDLEDIALSLKGNDLRVRGQEDILCKIESLFKQVYNKFNIEDHYFEVNLKSVVSLFGIHSNNLDTLLEHNKFYSVNESKTFNKNIAYLVDPKELNEDILQSRKILSLSEIVPINQNSVLYEPIYSQKENKIIGYFLNNLIDGNEVFSQSFEKERNKIESYGLRTTFLRYLGLQGLKNSYRNRSVIKDKPIFLPYDEQYIASENFDIDEFLSKIKSTKYKKENIILTFDIQNELQNTSRLVNNIIELKEQGFKTAVINFGSLNTNYSALDAYRPSYIFVENNIIEKINFNKENEEILDNIIKISKKIDAQLIATSIDTFMIFKTVQSHDIDLYTGTLIGSSIDIKEDLDNETKYLLNK